MQHITYVIHIIKFFPPKKNFLPFFNVTFQCGRYNLFKEKFKKVFDPGKVKKRASKIAHNWPRPFYSTVHTRPQPTTQNWFFVSWNRGTRHLFSYLWRKSKYSDAQFTIWVHPFAIEVLNKISESQFGKIQTLG